MKSLSNIFARATCGLLTFAALAVIQAQDSAAFNLVLLPDTQMYSQNHPEIFKAQTRWAADNASTITFVLQQGDITNKNVRPQWEVAQEAMSLMDGKVPYAFVTGNHDIGTNGKSDKRETGLFNEYFPYEKYSKDAHLAGAFEQGKMDNTWHTFKAGGHDWLVLCLEFGPRNSVLEWAGKIIQEHPDSNVIVNTHAYMYSDDTRIGKEDKWNPHTYGVGKDTGPDEVNDGEEIWNELVSQHPNVLMVVSGHVLNDGTGKLVSKGKAGNKVYQMLANYQGGVEGSQNGGNGYLRILNINPAKGTISVKTYSPHLDEFKTAADQQFEFTGVKF